MFACGRGLIKVDAALERPRILHDVSTLLALGAGLRLLFVWLVPRVLDSPDAVAYLQAARHIAAGDFASLDPKIPVLYPALIAITHQFIPDIESAGRAVSWVCSTLLIVPVYLLARELHCRGSARIAGLLIACWPWLIDYGSRVATEPVAVLLFLTGIYLLVRGWIDTLSPFWMAAAGTVFGLLHLARPEGMFLYLGAFVLLPILGWGCVNRRVTRVVAFSLPGIAALAVGALVTHAAAEVWTLNYRLGFIGDEPEGSTVARDFARTLVAMSADVPAVMLGPLLWMALGAGLVLEGPHPRDMRRESAVLLFAALQWFMVLPVLSPAPRYLMSAFVLLSIWSAHGIERTGEILGRRFRAMQYAPLVIVLTWMFFHATVLVVSERVDQDPPRQPREYKRAGEWMRDHLAPGTIVTRKPQIGFYAGMHTIGPAADATLDAIIAFGIEHGARYLVVDERYTAQLVPALRPLLDPRSAPEALRLISADQSPYASARLVIYEFTGKQNEPAPDR